MAEESPLNGKVVLVVDDEPDVLDTVEETLPMCVVEKAGDFDTALSLLEKNTYDLVILDIMGVRGFELLAHAVTRGFLTVMLTAHAATTESLRKSIKLGAASFLPKEYMADLQEVLEDILVGKGTRFWWKRSFDRTDEYFGRTFGSDWKEKDAFFKEFEEKLKST
ncbi:MAG: response regulator [Deltaproteobacteria bacterium]